MDLLIIFDDNEEIIIEEGLNATQLFNAFSYRRVEKIGLFFIDFAKVKFAKMIYRK